MDIDLPNVFGNNQASETVESVQFQKWGVIIPELKNHAISYFDGPTQFNYSQCSKICNQEMQRFDNQALKTITLSGLTRGQHDLVVGMRLNNPNKPYFEIQNEFVNVSDNQHKWIVSIHTINHNQDTTRMIEADNNRVYEEDMQTAALGYLERRCSRFNQQLRCELYIRSHYWPFCFNNFFLQRCLKCHWVVYLTDDSLNDFMSFAETLPDRMEMNIESTSHTLVIPSELCQTRMFLESDQFCCNQPIIVTDEQFLQCKATILMLFCKTISDQAIHQKIQYYLDNPQEDGVNISIFIYDGSREFDSSVIFGALDVHKQNYEEDEDEDDDNGEYFTMTKMNQSLGITFKRNAIEIHG